MKATALSMGLVHAHIITAAIATEYYGESSSPGL